MTTDQLDPTILQPRQLTAVIETTDDLVSTPKDRGHVQLARGSLCGAGNPANLGQRLRWAQ